MRIAIQTLGCKVNQYETQAMETLLTGRGHVLVPFDAEADAYIVNSCTVTATSDKKSRQAVRQAQRRAPHAIVALCGCFSQVWTDQAKALDADLIGGTTDRIAFLDALEELFKTRQKTVLVDASIQQYRFEPLPAGGLEGRTRAMLKIEDGCTNFCSYCIIPYARGRVRSLSPVDSALEIHRLVEQGYREIVLTGIEISSWGRDLDTDKTLIDLVEEICEHAPNCRIRLGSLEPRTVTEEFCKRLSRYPNLCPHFHLSLQSGCEDTLKRMNRKYDTNRYLESVQLLRKWFPHPAITTDLIVGFPGETELEFQQTLAFVKTCEFSSMHIFPYSRRSGTPAATMPGQLSNHEKANRVHRATALAHELEQAWLCQWIGARVLVLFEEERDGFWRGYTPQYTQVLIQGNHLHNQLCEVEITAIGQGVLYGQLCQKGGEK